jgi:hypothetical protein
MQNINILRAYGDDDDEDNILEIIADMSDATH